MAKASPLKRRVAGATKKKSKAKGGGAEKEKDSKAADKKKKAKAKIRNAKKASKKNDKQEPKSADQLNLEMDTYFASKKDNTTSTTDTAATENAGDA